MASVKNMLHRLGVAAEFRDSPSECAHTDRFILPGVGSFDEGIRRLKGSGWFSFLQDLPDTTQILGICLGMQLLGTSSEEGDEAGLGRVPVHFERFDSEQLRVPHMGWNTVEPVTEEPLFDRSLTELRYYFTHSYMAVCDEPGIETARTNYGTYFTSAFRVNNTRGVQFHPEKSHRFGMSLLKGWATLQC